MRKLTTEEVVERMMGVHFYNPLFDYSKVDYSSIHEKVIIICRVHGEFHQSPANHLKGRGCPKCRNENNGNRQRKTKFDFERESKLKHGNLYGYEESNYISSQVKLQILCKEHGPFFQSPANHLSGKGCPKCGYEKSGLANSIEESQVIQRFHNLHGNMYDYSEVVYTGFHNKVKIICRKHGYFYQTPGSHLTGKGCVSCGILKVSNSKKWSNKELLAEAKLKHNNYYEYSTTENDANNGFFTEMKIICPNHGEFRLLAKIHIRKGQGCPLCRGSRGEKTIIKILTKYKIEFIREKTFEDCRNPKTNRKLRFDFYLPDFNHLIEYDGQQHFQESWWRGSLEDSHYRDDIKSKYAKEVNIKLTRIIYSKNDIEIEKEIIANLKSLD